MLALGLLLVLVGAALAAAEAHVPSHGALGSGAVVALATGVALLVSAAGSTAIVAILAGPDRGRGGRRRAVAVMVRKALAHAPAARVEHADRPRRRRPRRGLACSSTAGSGRPAPGVSRATRRCRAGCPVVVENVNGLTLTVRPAEEWEVAP